MQLQWVLCWPDAAMPIGKEKQKRNSKVRGMARGKNVEKRKEMASNVLE
jgi:hypothetical protein